MCNFIAESIHSPVNSEMCLDGGAENGAPQPPRAAAGRLFGRCQLATHSCSLPRALSFAKRGPCTRRSSSPPPTTSRPGPPGWGSSSRACWADSSCHPHPYPEGSGCLLLLSPALPAPAPPLILSRPEISHELWGDVGVFTATGQLWEP